MKRIAIAISLAVLVFAVAIETWAQSETIVIGTNTYPADVQAVQMAVDLNDIVTLSGTFNFGQVTFPTPAGMITFSPQRSVEGR